MSLHGFAMLRLLIVCWCCTGTCPLRCRRWWRRIHIHGPRGMKVGDQHPQQEDWWLILETAWGMENSEANKCQKMLRGVSSCCWKGCNQHIKIHFKHMQRTHVCCIVVTEGRYSTISYDKTVLVSSSDGTSTLYLLGCLLKRPLPWKTSTHHVSHICHQKY